MRSSIVGRSTAAPGLTGTPVLPSPVAALRCVALRCAASRRVASCPGWRRLHEGPAVVTGTEIPSSPEGQSHWSASPVHGTRGGPPEDTSGYLARCTIRAAATNHANPIIDIVSAARRLAGYGYLSRTTLNFTTEITFPELYSLGQDHLPAMGVRTVREASGQPAQIPREDPSQLQTPVLRQSQACSPTPPCHVRILHLASPDLTRRREECVAGHCHGCGMVRADRVDHR